MKKGIFSISTCKEDIRTHKDGICDSLEHHEILTLEATCETGEDVYSHLKKIQDDFIKQDECYRKMDLSRKNSNPIKKIVVIPMEVFEISKDEIKQVDDK